MRVCHGCLSPVDNSRRILLPLQDLLFTTEVFLDLPSRKIGSCHFEHILFGLDFFICGKHHGMFCDAINQYQINIFSGSCNLDFDMGNVSLMIFPLIKYIGFNFPFATVAQFRSFKSNGIGGFITLFSWRMYFWKDTYRMIAGSKDTGFCYMVAFFINIFSRCAFRIIPYDVKWLNL